MWILPNYVVTLLRDKGGANAGDDEDGDVLKTGVLRTGETRGRTAGP